MATVFVLRPCRWAATLDRHHGEKTQKEINLAAQAICKMDSFLELWTWKCSVSASDMITQFVLLSLRAKMVLFLLLASTLLGTLAGLLPVVGMGSEREANARSDYQPPNLQPLPSPAGSNCSQLTLKLEFSSEVVEHGRKLFSLIIIRHVPHVYHMFKFYYGCIKWKKYNIIL